MDAKWILLISTSKVSEYSTWLFLLSLITEGLFVMSYILRVELNSSSVH